jgi:hypothetical protein
MDHPHVLRFFVHLMHDSCGENGARFSSQVPRDRPQGVAGGGEDGRVLRPEAPHRSRTCLMRTPSSIIHLSSAWQFTCMTLTGSTCLSCVQFLCKVFEDDDDDEKARAERSDHELALAKAVDAMAMGMEKDVDPADLLKQRTFAPTAPRLGTEGRRRGVPRTTGRWRCCTCSSRRASRT